MRYMELSWRRSLVPFWWRCAVVVAPLPAMAGEPTARPANTPSIVAAAQQAVAAQVKAATPATSSCAGQHGTAKTDLGTPSFFKSPAGIITLASLGAGVGYALYSTSHDRVKSPGK